MAYGLAKRILGYVRALPETADKKVLKKTHYAPDKQGESKMLGTLTTVSLPQTYCRSCHLSTRSDVARCLHCNKPLQAPPVMPRRTSRRVKHVAIRGR